MTTAHKINIFIEFPEPIFIQFSVLLIELKFGTVIIINLGVKTEFNMLLS
jgi:hypothetical protein